jgi:hypothetical protein
MQRRTIKKISWCTWLLAYSSPVSLRMILVLMGETHVREITASCFDVISVSIDSHMYVYIITHEPWMHPWVTYACAHSRLVYFQEKTWFVGETMLILDTHQECCKNDTSRPLTWGRRDRARSLQSSSMDTEPQQLHFSLEELAAQCKAVILLACAWTLEIVSPDSMSYSVSRPSSWPHARVRPSGLQHNAETGALSSKVSNRAHDILCTAMRFSPKTYAIRSMVGHQAIRHLAGSVESALSSAWTRRKLDMLEFCLIESRAFHWSSDVPQRQGGAQETRLASCQGVLNLLCLLMASQSPLGNWIFLTSAPAISLRQIFFVNLVFSCLFRFWFLRLGLLL